ncbi:MAG: cyclic nucleotide-binding domain-containing protein [Eubacterium sp.]|nr:cyclic nucleotide-binding domain-containing protein [Eubacterium sp.]
MQQYDEDYRTLISKLNGAFVEKQTGRASELAVFEGINSEKKKFIKSMPDEEIGKIGAKVRSNVTDITYLTKEEKQLLEEIKTGKKIKYKLVAFRLVGNIDTDEIMKQYIHNIWEEPAFRTVYLYKGLEEPVKVVCEARESAFPVHDIRNLSEGKQTLLIKNVLAAEMRRDYDIETDPVARIQGYLVGANEMKIIISIYPHIPHPSGLNGMLYKMLSGLTPQIANVPVVDEKVLEKMNEELREKSIEYWKRQIVPSGKAMTIPGESRNTDKGVFGKTFLYKELGQEILQSLNDYCEKNRISVKALFLFTWGNLMGKYHDEIEPLMAVAQHRGEMDMFPIRVQRNIPETESMTDIDRQLQAGDNYNNCSMQDVESAVDISFSDFFRMLHNFMEFSELDEIGNGRSDIKTIHGFDADDTDINLFISYHLYDNNIGINYVSKGGILESILENLHEIFVDELSKILSLNKTKFDKTTFIKVNDSDEEKLYKIKLAQTGLYLKESGLFESLTADEIMKLAEYCRLTSYLSNDMIVTEKNKISKIYIVGDGKLEESMTASDGMVKSLRIIKKGGVFGIESLFEKGIAGNTYTVVSHQAKMVEMDKEILTELFRRRPEGWIALLERENEQKSKLQRLWTME